MQSPLSPTLSPTEVFALLENTRQSDAPARLYRHPVAEIIALTPDELAPALQALDAKGPQHACGYIAYEAGYVLQGLPLPSDFTQPLLHFYLFNECSLLSAADVDALLADLAGTEECAIFDAALAENATDYTAKIDCIKAAIKAGETYQVNYTLPYRFNHSGTPAALYQALRQVQKVEFAGFLNFPEARVLSLSPELFLRRQGNELLTRPMKGTAPRGATPEADAAIRAQLHADPKTRAENLMIVDLLRNDLGRIATTGSVRVPQLFEIETYQTLHQMTSTVTAELNSDVGVADIIKSLFPCGSITGAPKHHTMQLIAELEPQARGIYCGALGYVEPAVNGVANFCFNVPIRTIVSTEPGKALMGTGGGIVYDSDAASEYAEAELKTRFLSEINAGFEILESIHYSQHEIANLEQHLARMLSSARAFGFAIDLDSIRQQLADHVARLGDEARRIRLALNMRGQLTIQDFPVAVIPAQPSVILSEQRINSQNIFRQHKTTRRTMYDSEYTRAEQLGAYEILFLNQYGRVAEASRHNLFVRQGNVLLTPPISEGALPGILRAKLLVQHQAIEHLLTLEDLYQADEILLGNAVRGLVKVTFQH